MCERCTKLRTERKEAILEFLNTESSYGEDLRIIKEEFYCPMQSAGLLTAEQLTVVFNNVQELIDVNDRFTEHLQDSIDQAFDQVTHTNTSNQLGQHLTSHLTAGVERSGCHLVILRLTQVTVSGHFSSLWGCSNPSTPEK